ncbi:MAG: type II toxin-antitoxin system CcdA family antitoxin [Candidatus Dormibacteraeota bacterium]|nr:type II toxin-antitoxin system CcdA family antitoxin [Candidatus Dormibacteraeota bacterium]MBV9526377.1 type II toxin-antitoxin system CcdA family antitoxin [Candidatus Dormibacteraeota bacterium]
MARVNVYLPNELAEAARAAELNVSSLAQAAIRRELRRAGIRDWVAAVQGLAGPSLSHEAVQEAVDSAREELGAPRA